MRPTSSFRGSAAQASVTKRARTVTGLDRRLRILLRHVLPPKAGGLVPARGTEATPNPVGGAAPFVTASRRLTSKQQRSSAPLGRDTHDLHREWRTKCVT